MPNGKPSALFASDCNLVLLNEFADVFEADWRFVQLDLVMLSQSIDQVGSGH